MTNAKTAPRICAAWFGNCIGFGLGAYTELVVSRSIGFRNSKVFEVEALRLRHRIIFGSFVSLSTLNPKPNISECEGFCREVDDL